jgi:hypothetical protein
MSLTPPARLLPLLAVLLLAAVPVFAGTTVCGRIDRKISAKDVKVFVDGATPPGPHRVLGVISVEKPGPGSSQPTSAYWAGIMSEEAARLGADAIVGLHWVSFAGGGRYFASGVAVARGMTCPPGDSCGCVVGLAAMENTTDAPMKLKHTDLSDTFNALRYLLEKRGYYLWTADVPDSLKGVARLKWAETQLGFPVRRALVASIEPEGTRATAKGGAVKITARLIDAGGRPLWVASDIEDFTDKKDENTQLPSSGKGSRTWHLLESVERLGETLPPPTGTPAAGKTR